MSNELLNFLMSRRSIRRFKPDPIPDEVLLKILDVARYAPSARNSQPWVFIVVKDVEIKRKLANIHPWAKPLENAPVGVVVACNSELSPESYQVDCANATMQLMLAAHAVGLGSVWLQTLRNIKDVQEIVGLPKNYIPVAMLALGVPDETPTAKKRKELKEIVYLDRYGSEYLP
ncbi:MAG: nitroreductase family protein [Sulfolobales archaeon]